MSGKLYNIFLCAFFPKLIALLWKLCLKLRLQCVRKKRFVVFKMLNKKKLKRKMEKSNFRK
jgi:hypothetical protein